MNVYEDMDRAFVLADEESPDPIGPGTRLFWIDRDGSRTPAVIERTAVRAGHLWAYVGIFGGHGRNWYCMGRYSE